MRPDRTYSRRGIAALYTSEVAFIFIFGGAFLGMLLRFVLPEPHLSSDTKDVIRLSTGLIATLSALVLGLLIASAQSTFQAQNNQIKQITANVVLLDNILARSGAQAEPVRVLLRSSVKTLIERIWGERDSVETRAAPFQASTPANLFFDRLLELSPQNDAQRLMQTRAVQIGIDLAQTRILLAESGNGIPRPFIAVLVFWLTLIFVSFGLFARPNLTIVAALLASAFSASAAIFLILDLSHPFSGLMAISSAPLSNALAPLGP
jgi:Protein of unknown function (DUF4239)